MAERHSDVIPNLTLCVIAGLTHRVIAGLTRNPLIIWGMLNQVQHDVGRGMLDA